MVYRVRAAADILVFSVAFGAAVGGQRPAEARPTALQHPTPKDKIKAID